MPYTIESNQLQPYDMAVVEGVLAPFSHLAKIVEGQALIEENKRRVAHGIPAANGPFTNASVYNAHIVPRTKPQPGQMPTYTLFESYLMERFFTRQNPDLPGDNYEGRNTGQFLPDIFVRQADGTYKKVALQRELAGNQPCKLVMRVFKAQPNNGVSLIAVLLDNEPQFVATGQRWMRELADYGLVLTDDTVVPGVADEGSAQESAIFAQTQNVNPNDFAFATGAPAPAPEQTYQQPQQVYQPQPQPQPQTYQPQPQQQQPGWNPQNMQFPPSNAQPTAVPSTAVPTDGIMFDPSRQ